MTSQAYSQTAPSGAKLTLLLSAGLLLLAISLLAAFGTGEDGIRSVIRWSARTSIALFLPVYAASSLLKLWPSPISRWLMKNRRWLGLSFAASHTIHLIAILALDYSVPAFEMEATTLVFGGMAYVFIALMAATSTDAAVRRLGAQRWRLLHKVGMHWIWAIFFVSYAPRAATGSPGYVVLTFLLVAALGLRIYSARSRRSATRPASSQDDAARQRLRASSG